MKTDYGPCNDCSFNKGKVVQSPLFDKCSEFDTYERTLLECSAFKVEREDLLNVFAGNNIFNSFIQDKFNCKIFDKFCNTTLLLKWEAITGIQGTNIA